MLYPRWLRIVYWLHASNLSYLKLNKQTRDSKEASIYTHLVSRYWARSIDHEPPRETFECASCPGVDCRCVSARGIPGKHYGPAKNKHRIRASLRTSSLASLDNLEHRLLCRTSEHSPLSMIYYSKILSVLPNVSLILLSGCFLFVGLILYRRLQRFAYKCCVCLSVGFCGV